MKGDKGTSASTSFVEAYESRSRNPTASKSPAKALLTLERMADVPHALAEKLVKPRTINGEERLYIDFKKPFSRTNADPDARVRELLPKGTAMRTALLRAQELWVANLEPIKKEAERPTLGEFVVNTWWPRHPHNGRDGRLAPSTIKKYADCLLLYVLPNLGSYRLDEIDRGLLDEFVAYLRAKGRKPKTVKNVFGVVTLIMNKAKDWGVIQHCPAFPSVKVKPGLHDYLRFVDKEKVLAATHHPVARTAFRFSMETGVRTGELFGIGPEQLQLETRWLHVVKSRTDYSEFIIPDLQQPRQSMRSVGFKPPKDDEDRSIPLTKQLVAEIEEHLDLTKPYLFSEFSPDALNDMFKMSVARAGISRPLRYYHCRHTFASQLAVRGIPLRHIQHWLGHGSGKMTESYAELKPEPGVPVAPLTGRETEHDLLDIAFDLGAGAR